MAGLCALYAGIVMYQRFANIRLLKHGHDLGYEPKGREFECPQARQGKPLKALCFWGLFLPCAAFPAQSPRFPRNDYTTIPRFAIIWKSRIMGGVLVKRLIALLLMALLMLTVALPATASNFYIIPDSNSRYLTETELWEWQYDALGYILNEIFARHGYHFEPGGKYDNYFRAQVWYRENEELSTNQQIYDKLVTDVVWHNERLVKDVREEMRALGTTNPGGRPLPSVAYEPPLSGAFSSFFAGSFAPNQKLNVFSGRDCVLPRGGRQGDGEHKRPGLCWRLGKRLADGDVLDEQRQHRVGYANAGDFRDKIQAQQLSFGWTPVTVTKRCG